MKLKILKTLIPGMLCFFASCADDGENYSKLFSSPDEILGTYIQTSLDYNIYNYHPGDPLPLSITISPEYDIVDDANCQGDSIAFYRNVTVAPISTPVHIPEITIENVKFRMSPYKSDVFFDIDYQGNNDSGTPFTVRIKGHILKDYWFHKVYILGKYDYITSFVQLEDEFGCERPSN